MIRLALAVGFLAVFGLVGYAVILLLTNHFKNENKNKPNNNH
jgi:preprotein translocase subunit Sss1